MALYEITTPGGEKFELEGPEGATEEELLAQVRKFQHPEGGESWLEDLGEGVVSSGMDTYYGLKELVTGELTPEEYERVADWKADAGQSGWGTAGNVVGEIGQLMIPGGAAMKGAKLLSKAKKAADLGSRARTLLAATDIAAAGGLEGVQLPGMGETREENLEAGLKAGLIGAGVGKVLRGATVTPQARRMLDKGVKLTPGQAAQSPLIQGVETVAEVTPFLARSVEAAKNRSLKSLNKAAFREATPPGAKAVTETGAEGVQQLKKGFTEAYEKAWSGATNLAPASRVRMVEMVEEALPRLTEQQAGIMRTIAKDFRKLTANPTAAKLKAFDNLLRKRVNSTSKQDYDFSELLKALRSELREGIPNEVAEKLAKVDAKYGDFLVLRRAVKNAAAEEGQEMVPKHLVGAMKAVGKDRAGEGTAPMYQFATDAAQTAGRAVGGQPLEWFRRVARFAPGAPADLFADYAIGRGVGQRTLRRTLEELEKRGMRAPMITGAMGE